MAAHKYGMEGSDVQMIQRRGEARDGWNENKCGWMVMLVGGGASSGLFEFSIPGLGFFYYRFRFLTSI